MHARRAAARHVGRAATAGGVARKPGPAALRDLRGQAAGWRRCDRHRLRGGTWTKGKGCETFGPVGPWLVTKDEIANVQKLDMWLDVNGQKRQRGNTRTMIFGIAHIVWYCSQFFVLEPGDVITTGTPPGVALGMKPPVWLKAGDVVTLGIQGLGEQKQKIVKFRM